MSEYTDALKAGMQRVNDLTAQYAEALEISQHGMAAVIRGELSAARAYLQGMTDAGELRLKAQLEEDNNE
jgi:N-methylhydantoinase B/oxoprolinase/acetone carboxylase alpha subunit